MTESELGGKVRRELERRGVKLFKLHNTMFQRGLLDYVLWRADKLDGESCTLNGVAPLVMAELKRAESLEEALGALSSGQRSVFESLACTSVGAWLLWGSDRAGGGVGVRMRRKDGSYEWRMRVDPVSGPCTQESVAVDIADGVVRCMDRFRIIAVDPESREEDAHAGDERGPGEAGAEA